MHLRTPIPTEVANCAHRQDGVIARSRLIRAGLVESQVSRLVRAEVLIRGDLGIYTFGARERSWLRYAWAAALLGGREAGGNPAVSVTLGEAADAGYAGLKIVRELDGRAFQDGEHCFRYWRRDKRGSELGWLTLRYGWHDTVVEPCRTAGHFGRVATQRGWAGGLRKVSPMPLAARNLLSSVVSALGVSCPQAGVTSGGSLCKGCGSQLVGASMQLGFFGQTAAVACAVVVLTAGCTRSDPPPPPPTPTASQSPTESAQERQERLDYAAAEKAYRTFRAEYNRVLRAGGAKEPTKIMKATAGGPYLGDFVEAIRAASGLGDHDEGEEKVVFVRPAGYSTASLLIDVCEDSRDIQTFDKNDKPVGVGEIRTAQIEVEKREGAWKLWTGSGKKVTSCE